MFICVCVCVCVRARVCVLQLTNFNVCVYRVVTIKSPCSLLGPLFLLPFLVNTRVCVWCVCVYVCVCVCA